MSTKEDLDLDLDFGDLSIDIDFTEIDKAIETAQKISLDETKPETKEEPKKILKPEIVQSDTMKVETKSPQKFIISPEFEKPKQVYVYHYRDKNNNHYFTTEKQKDKEMTMDDNFIEFRALNKKINGTIAIHRFKNKDPLKGYIYGEFDKYKNDYYWKDDGILCYVFEKRENIFNKEINPHTEMLKPIFLFSRTDFTRFKLTSCIDKQIDYNRVGSIGFGWIDKITSYQCLEPNYVVVVEEPYNGDIESYYQTSHRKYDKYHFRNYSGTPSPVFVGIGFPTDPYKKTVPIYSFMIELNVYFYGKKINIPDEYTCTGVECRIFIDQQPDTVPIYVHRANDKGGSFRLSVESEIKGYDIYMKIGYGYTFNHYLKMKY